MDPAALVGGRSLCIGNGKVPRFGPDFSVSAVCLRFLMLVNKNGGLWQFSQWVAGGDRVFLGQKFGT